jgi:hypothetical protein
MSETLSLTRPIRSKFSNFSRDVDEVDGCKAPAGDILDRWVRERRGVLVENRDADVGIAGRRLKKDNMRFIRIACACQGLRMKG